MVPFEKRYSLMSWFVWYHGRAQKDEVKYAGRV